MVASNDLNISVPGFVSFDGVSTFNGRTLTAGTGISISNGDGISGNPVITASASSPDLHTARFIVSAGGFADGANYGTIAAAITAAQAAGGNQTIFIQPGTYTENLTLTNGINLAAYTCDGFTPNVTILGKISISTAGTVSISGLRLQTNSDFLLSVGGSSITVVNLINCYLQCFSTGIQYTTSNTSSQLHIDYCIADLKAGGIGLYTMSSTGTLTTYYLDCENGAGSTTASTCSAGAVSFNYTNLPIALTFSGAANSNGQYSAIGLDSLNTSAIITSGTGQHNYYHSRFQGGTASALSIGAGTSLLCALGNVSSSNANAITGAGELKYAFISFSNSSSTVNTSTLTPLATLI